MLRSTATSRKQHEVLRRLADELVALLDQPALDEVAVHDTLKRMGGALKHHSEMEVEGMYPQLMQHPDEEIRVLAAKMIHTIKDVYDGFVTFQDAWTLERMRKKPEAFVKQARFIVKAFHESTAREEEVIYTRVDAALEALESG